MATRDKRRPDPRELALGRNLARLRNVVGGGMSQVELADEMRRLGWNRWSQSTVWSVETGQRPLRLSEAVDIVAILEARLDDLVMPGSDDARGLVEAQREASELLKHLAFFDERVIEVQERLARSIASYEAGDGESLSEESVAAAREMVRLMQQREAALAGAEVAEGFGAYGEGPAVEVEFIPESDYDPEQAPVKEAEHGQHQEAP